MIVSWHRQHLQRRNRIWLMGKHSILISWVEWIISAEVSKFFFLREAFKKRKSTLGGGVNPKSTLLKKLQKSLGPLAQDGSLKYRGSIHNVCSGSVMSIHVILIYFCKANFSVTCHFPDQDSRGPVAQDGSVVDTGSFHKSSSIYFILCIPEVFWRTFVK